MASDQLIASVMRALSLSRRSGRICGARDEALAHLNGLTLRQKQVMALVLSGHPSKNIAADLGISQRTIENHRAAIMERTGVHSLPELARLVMSTQIEVRSLPSLDDPDGFRFFGPHRLPGPTRPKQVSRI